jgi:quercetin dioxygenase-like cupin family protein
MEHHYPFQVINWDSIEKEEHKGEQGTSSWKVCQLPGLRIRMVEYLPGYFANHWCRKGHIVQCLEGSFISELDNGESFTLNEGMFYVVSDDLSSHRSSTKEGAKLLIIDGDFLGQ